MCIMEGLAADRDGLEPARRDSSGNSNSDSNSLIVISSSTSNSSSNGNITNSAATPRVSGGPRGGRRANYTYNKYRHV